MIMVRCIFRSRYKLCTVPARDSIMFSLLDSLPNEKLPIAFCHLYSDSIEVFIGEEIQHQVEKFLHRLQLVCTSKNKVSLKFQGQMMSLNMIKNG